MVLAEALDRVSRDQADVATLYKHLQFARVPLVTLAEGEISELHVDLKGTMNALFLKDLAKKTHRGLRGRVEKGFSAGPVGYGYRSVRRLSSEGELVRGECRIEPSEALVVERIFREFAAGKSPRAIARDLNADGVPGPSGRPWSDTTMRGKRSRGIGILNNEMYAGVRVWNHKHCLKDPRTGRTVDRTNPESEWVRVEVPQLRIVSDDLWQAVKERQDVLAVEYKPMIDRVHAAQASRMHLARRPAYLLSGLVECGVCGGKIGVAVNGRYGCLNHHRRPYLLQQSDHPPRGAGTAGARDSPNASCRRTRCRPPSRPMPNISIARTAISGRRSKPIGAHWKRLTAPLPAS